MFGIETCLRAGTTLCSDVHGREVLRQRLPFFAGNRAASRHDSYRRGHGEALALSGAVRFKLEAKGVKSVASRVTNLEPAEPRELTIAKRMKDALLEAFADEYGEACHRLMKNRWTRRNSNAFARKVRLLGLAVRRDAGVQRFVRESLFVRLSGTAAQRAGRNGLRRGVLYGRDGRFALAARLIESALNRLSPTANAAL